MCGIAGLLSKKQTTAAQTKIGLRKMLDAIHYRGPDAEGFWFDQRNEVSLGHKRLAIQDLSEHGAQPMVSSCGRYVIAFNGEVYNFKQLATILSREGIHFKGHSDTEVMLAAIVQWGLQAALEKFVGMFAFALYDQAEKKLYLVRDRIGIKPLYYGWIEGDFIFSSELSSIKAVKNGSLNIDQNILATFLRHSYIPAPHSIYKGIYKLLPGTILTIPLENHTKQMQPEPYWTLEEKATQQKNNQPFSETKTQLKTLLSDAVNLRMISDVSLGAFLSGGIDSSLVVALMQENSNKKVKTFSIGFNHDQYNEAHHAKNVANHLQTDHTELYVTAQQAMNVIEKLPHIYNEPFADSSQIPTFLVSELAKKHVTVSLSGDGGDELFAGYHLYFIASPLWDKIQRIPPFLRPLLSCGLKKIPVGAVNSLMNNLQPLLPRKLRMKQFGDKLHKAAKLFSAKDLLSLYKLLVSQNQDPLSLLTASHEPETLIKKAICDNNIENMMYFDQKQYLPDDILAKVDRASMSVSLEVRTPLLDHRIIEFAWNTPLEYKISGGQSKWLLRQILYDYVPKEMIERPKMGFAVPIGDWLRGSLKPWAEELINEKKLKEQGFFQEKNVQRLWKNHLTKKVDAQHQLWPILMFQSWLESN